MTIEPADIPMTDTGRATAGNLARHLPDRETLKKQIAQEDEGEIGAGFELFGASDTAKTPFGEYTIEADPYSYSPVTAYYLSTPFGQRSQHASPSAAKAAAQADYESALVPPGSTGRGVMRHSSEERMMQTDTSDDPTGTRAAGLAPDTLDRERAAAAEPEPETAPPGVAAALLETAGYESPWVRFEDRAPTSAVFDVVTQHYDAALHVFTFHRIANCVMQDGVVLWSVPLQVPPVPLRLTDHGHRPVWWSELPPPPPGLGAPVPVPVPGEAAGDAEPAPPPAAPAVS